MKKFITLLVFMWLPGLALAENPTKCADFTGWYNVEDKGDCQMILGGNFAWFKQTNCEQIQVTFLSTHWSNLTDFSESDVPVLQFSGVPLIDSYTDGTETETNTTSAERLSSNIFRLTDVLVSSIYPNGTTTQLMFSKEKDGAVTVLRKTDDHRIQCRLTPTVLRN